jgi:hypothetical protein
MEVVQQGAGATVQSVVNFVHDNAVRLGIVATSGVVQKLEGLLVVFTGHQGEQVDRSRQARAATQVHYANRKSLLRQHMAGVVAVARAEDETYPELRVLRMPPTNSSVTRLLAAAQEQRTGAAEHADVFIAAGLPADFLAQLDSAIAGMLQALEERKDVFGKAVGATRGIRTTIAAARKQIQILDKLVKTALAGDDSLLRNWEQIKRMPRAPRSSGSASSSKAGSGSAVVSASEPVAVPAAVSIVPATVPVPVQNAA